MKWITAILLCLACSAANATLTVLSLTDVMPGTAAQAKAYNFDIPTLGTYEVTLTDLNFPNPFVASQAGVSITGGALVFSETSPGTGSFVATEIGKYTAMVFGQPQGLGGSYSLRIVDPIAAPVPEPSTLLLVAGGTALLFGALRRR